MTCPKCGSKMETRTLGNAEVSRCTSCSGIFLERADLGNLVEAENDWHANVGTYHTEPLPRITADMTAPPPSKPKARSFIETLFG
ncbi:MAG TPA: zf-TFIIB domain-containing protein [Nocardioidaceae bacterium]|nr:zf-TFIIB domain-containing protein [Nocardioidaceae bacterium]